MEEKKSHKSNLKTLTLVGSSNIVIILLGIIRTKVIAVMIGPSGLGFMSVFQNLFELIRSFASLGMNYSAVKEVASSSNDHLVLSKSIILLKRWSLSTGFIGMVLTILFSSKISLYTFGSTKHSFDIIVLSITILFSSVSGIQLAILQGVLKIKEMIKAGLYSSMVSSIIVMPLYYFLKQDAIVPGMLIISIGSLFYSWYYSRRVKIADIFLTYRDTCNGGISVIKLGFFITITGLLTNSTMYFVRILIIKKSDLAIVGVFQACWTISSLYLNIFLNSLMYDFYPRLSKVNNDSLKMRNAINEQIDIILPIAAPIILGLIAFSKLIINLLYSSDFSTSVPILQWQLAGTFFIIISWPLGVYFLSSNKGSLSFFTELIRLVSFLLVIFLGFDFFGNNILGIAYLFSNFVACVPIFLLNNKLIGFNYTTENTKKILIYTILVTLGLSNMLYIESIYLQTFLSSLVIIIALLYSYFILNKIIDISSIIKSRVQFFHNKIFK